jgi:hypothetical protein
MKDSKKPITIGPKAPPPVTPRPQTNEFARPVDPLGTRSLVKDNVSGKALSKSSEGQLRRAVLSVFEY